MTTIEGNKLIAEFYTGRKCYSTRLLKYHTSWDWLMPVVEAIKELCVPDDGLYDSDQFTLLRDHLICVQIEVTWQHVVDFIEWYNKQS